MRTTTNHDSSFKFLENTILILNTKFEAILRYSLIILRSKIEIAISF